MKLFIALLVAGTVATVRGVQSNKNYNSELIESIYQVVSTLWETEGLEALSSAVNIDSLSPAYRSNWDETGELYEILNYYITYAEKALGHQSNITHKIYGVDTPPFLRITIPGNDQCSFTIPESMQMDGSSSPIPELVLYTHADIQPFQASEWTTTTDPLVTERLTTKDRDGLYGRGTTDDKYAFFASIIAVQTFIKMDLCYPTIHIVVETEEESDSPHLDQYMDELIEDLQVQPEVVYVLDSGGPDNDHIWNTRTLRGLLVADLTVEIAENSVHSGTAGGIVPSPFRLMNQLIQEKVEALNGTVIAPSLMHQPTEEDRKSALELANLLGDKIFDLLPWIPGASPMADATEIPTTNDIANMLIRNYYESTLTITGWDHAVIPDIGAGGNIIQPYIKVRLSFRCSPYTDVDGAFDELKQLVEAGPHSYGASVELKKISSSQGFAASPLPDWYSSIVDEASEQLYDGQPMLNSGIGGTIGFLSIIKEALYDGFGNDNTIMHNTGLFDPTANGHARDESLDINAAKRFNTVLTYTMHQIMVERADGTRGGNTGTSNGGDNGHSSTATMSIGMGWWMLSVAAMGVVFVAESCFLW